MPTIADYITIRPRTVSLTHSQSIQLSPFRLTNVAVDAESILTFRVDPRLGAAGFVRLQMNLNDRPILTQTFNTTQQRSWHEIIDGRVLREGTNDLMVSAPEEEDDIDTGLGQIVVSHFVLFFQANNS